MLNKIDLLNQDEQSEICEAIVDGLKWKGPVYRISALNKEGVKLICHDIMKYLEADESL